MIDVYRLDRDAEHLATTHDAQAVFQSDLLPELRIDAAMVFKPARAD
jgi:hypothetical protein